MKQITMSNFGNNGRLGNQLFQYASLLGLAHKHKADLLLPDWKYKEYFTGSFPGVIGDGILGGREVKETTFSYVPDWSAIRENDEVDINGYLQSYKYWQDIETEVKDKLTFKPDFIERVKQSIKFNSLTDPIAISIRRGDYVDNENYHLLPVIGYYYKALTDFFPDWKERDIVIFSDDIPYCRVHFGCLPNVTFSENNSDIEDLCLMSLCDDYIIGNSTFSWWGAYLNKHNFHKIVVRPVHHFKGPLLRKNDIKDYYPTNYYAFNHWNFNMDNRIELSDVSFQIPVYYDHPDREENLKILIRYLRKYFNTEIIICEIYNGQNQKFKYLSEEGNHFQVDKYYTELTPYMHRTKALNKMAKATNKPFIFNWDADVFIAPLQILQAVEMLRAGADMVYPYKWAFARMPRNIWFEKIRDYEDIGLVGDTRFNGMNTSDVVSVGGAVGFNRESFIKGGMENENFISYGAEDVERIYRFEKLGYNIQRVLGDNMYHLNHFVGPNSLNKHQHFKSNDAELDKVKAMNKEGLQEYVNTWIWTK